MPNEFIFGTTKRRLTDAQARRLRAIAREHDADFIGPVQLPGNPIRGWFTTRNMGSPFNEATRNAVMADVAADPRTASLFASTSAHAESYADRVERASLQRSQDAGLDELRTLGLADD